MSDLKDDLLSEEDLADRKLTRALRTDIMSRFGESSDPDTVKVALAAAKDIDKAIIDKARLTAQAKTDKDNSNKAVIGELLKAAGAVTMIKQIVNKPLELPDHIEDASVTDLSLDKSTPAELYKEVMEEEAPE